MQTRRLGRTNHLSSMVIFGGAALWNIDQEGANAALDLALAAGINHLDVAPQYGVAEDRLGPWLDSRRDQFFLGCKTLERTREGAWTQLHESLKKLHTNRVDLHQLHAITTFEELNLVMAPGGAMEALIAAQEQGLTRYLGITGHGLQAPAIQMEALRRFDFDTVMFPINPALYANPDYRRDAEQLLQLCAAQDVGVMVIKSVAKGPWKAQEKRYNTWYEPYDVQEKISRHVRFALSQPAVTGIAAAGEVHILPLILQAVAHFQPMNPRTQEAMVEESKTSEPLFV